MTDPTPPAELRDWSHSVVWEKGQPNRTRFYICHATDGDDCVGPFATEAEANIALAALRRASPAEERREPELAEDCHLALRGWLAQERALSRRNRIDAGREEDIAYYAGRVDVLTAALLNDPALKFRPEIPRVIRDEIAPASKANPESLERP